MHERIKSILEASAVPYKVYLHREMPIEVRSPQDFASALGYEVARIAKTLLLQAADSERFCVAVLSSNASADLRVIAESLSAEGMRIASKQALARVLGYPQTGVSPIGARGIPVLIDEALMQFPSVLIGGGEVGVEIEIAPQSLKQITDAAVLPLAARKTAPHNFRFS